jgi:MFS family permease
MEIRQPTTALQRNQNVYQEYPTAFWVLMTGPFIDRLGTNFIMPFLAIYVVQRFDAKITQVGLIYTIFASSSGLGNFLVGALADRFGRRFTLILGLVCAATARLALGLATNFTGVYFAAGLAGLFGAIGWYGCSIICAISIVGFYRLHLHARKRLIEKHYTDILGGEERS